MVPEKGLEPPRPCEHMDLNHACLPISPLRHRRAYRSYRMSKEEVNSTWIFREQTRLYPGQRTQILFFGDVFPRLGFLGDGEGAFEANNVLADGFAVDVKDLIEVGNGEDFLDGGRNTA